MKLPHSVSSVTAHLVLMALVLSLTDFNDFLFSALEDRIEEQRRERERLCWRTEEVQNVRKIVKKKNLPPTAVIF
jgi:hypothetical protein